MFKRSGKFLFIFLLIVAWIFSGWPQIWQNPPIPPEVQEARAATETTRPATHNDVGTVTTDPTYAYDASGNTTQSATVYAGDLYPSITFYNFSSAGYSYSSLTLKVEYEAELGSNDQYGIKYSTDNTSGTCDSVTWTSLVAMTSVAAADHTLVSASLSAGQDLTKICVRVDSEKVTGPDNKNVFIEDIRTEGVYTPPPPTVTTSAASSITETTATLNGSITNTGGANATVRGFAYSTSANLTTGVSTTTESGDWGVEAFTYGVSILTADTTYYFRAYATNANGTGYGTILNFSTASASSLTVIVSTDTFSTVVPGGDAVFATSTIDVNTNSASGWNVTLYGNSQGAANTVMDLNDYASVGITDQLEWVAGAATTTAGNAVQIGSFDNSGDVLAFRMMTASGTASFLAPDWWGSADDYSDNANTLWAGIASSTNVSQIGNSSVNSGGGSALNTALYYLKVSNTQQSGAYAGDLTFTTVVN